MNYEPIQFLPIKHERPLYGRRREWLVEIVGFAICAAVLILLYLVC